MKKYEINSDGRVVALRNFGDVKAGDVGGFVDSEANLSHDGDCWVNDDARVSGWARVFDDAQVSGHAHVSGHAWVYGRAKILGGTKLSGNAVIC
jgi:hypothetical protein